MHSSKYLWQELFTSLQAFIFNCEYFWLFVVVFWFQNEVFTLFLLSFIILLIFHWLFFILNCTGYIDHVSELAKNQSSNGNQYFHAKLKISSRECYLVKITKRQNYSITRKYFLDMLSSPVTVCYFIIHTATCQL